MRCASRARSRSSLIGLVAIVMVAGSLIQKGGATARQTVLTAQTGGVTCHMEQVPMRDGTLLATDVYLPAAPGRYPVIVRRTPYGLRLGQGCFEGSSAGMAFWAENGYVAVSQDVRGTFRSEGTFRPIFQEQADGYDAIEWAAAQAWSNGKVGMTGSSYMGATQWQAAMTAPPHLVAIAPGQTATDYHDHWTYVNGVFDLWFAQSWLLAFFAPDEHRRQQIEEGVPPADALTASDEYLARGERQIFSTWARQIPLASFSEYRTLAPYYYEWLEHPNYDDYWATVDVEAQWEKILVPALVNGAWGDLFAIGSVSCALGFSWTLDCERVLAGGVSRWGNQIKNRRRRRKPEGRPETPPGAAVGDGCQPGASARRCCVCCAERILSPCRGSWGSRRRGPRRAGSVSGRGPGQPEEPGAGRLGRGASSAASQDR